MESLLLPIETIKEFLSSISEAFTTILDLLNPFSENFIIKKLVDMLKDLFYELFVPSEDIFSDLYNKFESKFTFIFQIKDLLNEFLSYSDYGNEKYPSFNIKYGDLELNIIDFSAFEPYRVFLHNIILVVCWVPFLFKLYKRLPNFINGEGE